MVASAHTQTDTMQLECSVDRVWVAWAYRNQTVHPNVACVFDIHSVGLLTQTNTMLEFELVVVTRLNMHSYDSCAKRTQAKQMCVVCTFLH